MRALTMLAKFAADPNAPQGMGQYAMPVVAGGAGGVGAYMLLRKMLQPTIHAQEETVRRATAALTKTKMMPLVAGALGALIIGTLAAQKARNDERKKIQYEMAMQSNRMYQQNPMGYNMGEQVRINGPVQHMSAF